MLNYDRKTEKMTAIDARETGPLACVPEMFTRSNCRTQGGLAIATPGEIKGYWTAHQRFGKLEWSKLFQPAIEM